MARRMYRVLFGRQGFPSPPYPTQDEDFFNWAIKPETNEYVAAFLKDQLNRIAEESYDRDFESLKSNLYKYGKTNPVIVNNDTPWYDFYRDNLTDEFIKAFNYPPTPTLDPLEINIEDDVPIDDDLEIDEVDPYATNPLLGGGSNGSTTGQDAATASAPVTAVGTTETGTGTQASSGGSRNGGGTRVVTQTRTVYPPIVSTHLPYSKLESEPADYRVDLQKGQVNPYIDDEIYGFIKNPKKGRKRLMKGRYDY